MDGPPPPVNGDAAPGWAFVAPGTADTAPAPVPVVRRSTAAKGPGARGAGSTAAPAPTGPPPKRVQAPGLASANQAVQAQHRVHSVPNATQGLPGVRAYSLMVPRPASWNESGPDVIAANTFPTQQAAADGTAALLPFWPSSSRDSMPASIAATGQYAAVVDEDDPSAFELRPAHDGLGNDDSEAKSKSDAQHGAATAPAAAEAVAGVSDYIQVEDEDGGIVPPPPLPHVAVAGEQTESRAGCVTTQPNGLLATCAGPEESGAEVAATTASLRNCNLGWSPSSASATQQPTESPAAAPLPPWAEPVLPCSPLRTSAEPQGTGAGEASGQSASSDALTTMLVSGFGCLGRPPKTQHGVTSEPSLPGDTANDVPAAGGLLVGLSAVRGDPASPTLSPSASFTSSYESLSAEAVLFKQRRPSTSGSAGDSESPHNTSKALPGTGTHGDFFLHTATASPRTPGAEPSPGAGGTGGGIGVDDLHTGVLRPHGSGPKSGRDRSRTRSPLRSGPRPLPVAAGGASPTSGGANGITSGASVSPVGEAARRAIHGLLTATDSH